MVKIGSQRDRGFWHSSSSLLRVEVIREIIVIQCAVDTKGNMQRGPELDLLVGFCASKRWDVC